MIKEPMQNIVGLKALAWDIERATFVSPARPEFVWSPGGLQMGECTRCGHEPKENCSCGLYTTFDINIALEYIHYSLISPIFLVEASGITHLYSDGFRSQELTIHAVAPNSDTAESRLAASQAADYFQIPVTNLGSLIIAMDLHDKPLLLNDYQLRSNELKEQPYGVIDHLIQEMRKAKNEQRVEN